MKTNLRKVNLIVDLAKLLITILIALVCVTVLILLVSDGLPRPSAHFS